jgi:hypothetical protein
LAVLAVVCVSSCSSDYEPPSHTYTGFPEYRGIGVSVWGTASPVLIGDPMIGVPAPMPDNSVDQMPLDPSF